jgi:hypothetical protein
MKQPTRFGKKTGWKTLEQQDFFGVFLRQELVWWVRQHIVSVVVVEERKEYNLNLN